MLGSGMMMSGKVLLALAGICLATEAMADDPTGIYDVTGVVRDASGSYTGSVEVTKTGETFAVTWTLGEDVTTGIGIASGEGPDAPNRFAIAFGSTQSFGVLDLTLQPDGSWNGPWVYVGGQTISVETWTRRGVTKNRLIPAMNRRPGRPTNRYRRREFTASAVQRRARRIRFQIVPPRNLLKTTK